MQMNVYTLNIYDSETKYILSIDKILKEMSFRKMRKFSKIARSARSHIHRISSMLLFCRYFVVYSAIPQVIKVNCIDCICIYTDVLMSHVFMYLRDFSRFFHLKKKLCRSCFGICYAICNYFNPDSN